MLSNFVSTTITLHDSIFEKDIQEKFQISFPCVQKYADYRLNFQILDTQEYHKIQSPVKRVLFAVTYLAWNALKALFCKSDWQVAQKTLKEKIIIEFNTKNPLPSSIDDRANRLALRILTILYLTAIYASGDVTHNNVNLKNLLERAAYNDISDKFLFVPLQLSTFASRLMKGAVPCDPAIR